MWWSCSFESYWRGGSQEWRVSFVWMFFDKFYLQFFSLDTFFSTTGQTFASSKHSVSSKAFLSTYLPQSGRAPSGKICKYIFYRRLLFNLRCVCVWDILVVDTQFCHSTLPQTPMWYPIFYFLSSLNARFKIGKLHRHPFYPFLAIPFSFFLNLVVIPLIAFAPPCSGILLIWLRLYFLTKLFTFWPKAFSFLVPTPSSLSLSTPVMW